MRWNEFGPQYWALFCERIWQSKLSTMVWYACTCTDALLGILVVVIRLSR